MNIKVLQRFFASDRKIKFAYLFGSFARKDVGPLSDVDIAVYLDDGVDYFKYRLKLIEGLAKILRTENFDLVMLNDAPSVLKYEIVRNGIVLKDDRAKRVIFETRVLYEYLDTAYLRIVQRRYMKEKLTKGEYFG
jgi:hypothetical protein